MLRREAWILTRQLVKRIREEKEIHKTTTRIPMSGKIGFMETHPSGTVYVWLPLMCRWWLRRAAKKVLIKWALAQYPELCEDTGGSNCSSAIPMKNTSAPWMKPKEVDMPDPPPNQDTREGLIPKPKKD